MDDPAHGSARLRAHAYGLAGFAAVAVLVVCASRAGSAPGAYPPAGPWGLWRQAPTGRGWYAALAAAAICALAIVFVRLYRDAVLGRLTTAAVARTAAVWWVPALAGPPLLSLDAYSYTAQGWMLLVHLDPYAGGPDQLGSGPLLDAVSPVWRATPAPYGPLAMALLRTVAAIGGGDLPLTVYLLRALAVVGVAGAAVATVRLAAPPGRAAALTLVVANPLVVVHLVGGAHLDALLAGLAAATVLAVRRRWYPLATLLAATAFAVKLPGLVLVGYVLLTQLRIDGGPANRRLWANAGLAAAVTAGYTLLVPHGWGWIGALNVPGRIRHPYDPATLLGAVLRGLAWLFGVPVDFTSAVTAGREFALAVSPVAVFWLIWRATRRPGRDAATISAGAAAVGAALEAVALSAPAVHPWYLVWGLTPIAAGASARGRYAMVALSVAFSFAALPDALPGGVPRVVISLALLAAASSVVVWAVRADRRRQPDAAAARAAA